MSSREISEVAAIRGSAWSLVFFVLLLLPLPLIAFINTAPGGMIIISRPFTGYSTWASTLFPEGRLKNVQVAGEDGQSLQQEPVYFTVRLPRTMDSATVTVHYLAQGDPGFSVGLEQRPTSAGDTWHYELKGVNAEKSDQWQRVTLSFSLHQAAVIDGRIRFIMAAPRLHQSGNSLLVGSTSVELKGAPLSWQSIVGSLAQKIKSK